MIRHATVQDVPALGKMINDCAEYGLMLHRSQSFLYEHVREFHVALEGDVVVGVCGLRIVWASLAEVYALAIDPTHRRQGWGKRLVDACVDEARQLSIRRLMTLTYEMDFFKGCGFDVVDRQQLPLKVWSDCVGCSKNQACDEIAMVHILEDVPEVTAPRPASQEVDAYEAPVTLGVFPRRQEKRPKMDEAQ